VPTEILRFLVLRPLEYMEMEIKIKIIRTRASHFRAAQVLKKKGKRKPP